MKLAIAATLGVLLSAGAARAADLTLTLRAQGAGGTLAIAVYDDATAFRSSRDPVLTRIVPAAGGAVPVTLSGLAPGRYAVAVFHDADGNGELTLWPFGLPKEAYGFSRNARGRFGPPAFEAAAFDLPPEGARQAITLR
jgi:uncharacterized protein (DUF2141 family)